MWTAFVLVAGMLIGWQFPQPSWAAALQKKATDKIAGWLTFTSR